MTGMPVHRPVLITDAGAVVSGHHKASGIGAAVLRAGGNAMDAAIAASAALCVAIPHMNGLGGDCMALYFEAGARSVTAINGTGKAPLTTSAEMVRKAGHAKMPVRGPYTVSVPGLVDAWDQCLRRFGSRKLPELLAPAAQLAQAGIPADLVLANFLGSDMYRALIAEFPALAALYGPAGGRVLGDRIRNPALAETITSIAGDGRHAFYRGGIAEALIADARRAGVPFEPADFERHRTRFDSPLTVDLAGRRLHASPPNAQGLALSVLAGLYNLDSAASGRFPRLSPAHYLPRKDIAFRCREQFAGDPDIIARPDHVLGRRNFEALHGSLGRPLPAVPAYRPAGDTSALAVIDRWGNAVSWVQSLFEEFGSGIVSEATGIVLHNRLALQSISGEGPWPLRPAHRPFHTLCPALLEREGQCELAIATPGDHGQPQTIMQVLTRLLGEGLNIQAAIEAPRMRHDSGQQVMLEDRAPASWHEEIAAAGLTAQPVGPWSRLMGGVNGLHRQQDGLLFAGADPRRACYAVTAD